MYRYPANTTKKQTADNILTSYIEAKQVVKAVLNSAYCWLHDIRVRAIVFCNKPGNKRQGHENKVPYGKKKIKIKSEA